MSYWICTIPFFTTLPRNERTSRKKIYRNRLRHFGYEEDSYRFATEKEAVAKQLEIRAKTKLVMVVTEAMNGGPF